MPPAALRPRHSNRSLSCTALPRRPVRLRWPACIRHSRRGAAARKRTRANGVPRRLSPPLLRALLLFLCLAPPAFAQDGSDYWYETGAQQIIGSAEDGPDRSTPRQTLRGFTAASDAGDYRLAAQFLNLSRLARG